MIVDGVGQLGNLAKFFFRDSLPLIPKSKYVFRYLSCVLHNCSEVNTCQITLVYHFGLFFLSVFWSAFLVCFFGLLFGLLFLSAFLVCHFGLLF